MGTLEMIDFHSHFIESAWVPQGPPAGTALAKVWEVLTGIDAQLAAMDAAGVDVNVISAPLSMLIGDGHAPDGLVERVNERFAELIQAHPGRLLALATVDAFDGDAAAREVERAVVTLGLNGVCVDCADGERFLNVPECRPVLETVAKLGVPLFVHPVSPAGYADHLRQHGHIGVLMARGTEAAAGMYALLRGGILNSLPDLTIVMPLIAGTLLLFAGLLDQESERDGGDPTGPSDLLRRLYVDTMGFNADVTRFTIEMLGADHVLAGSDWPVMPIVTRERATTMLDGLAISDEERAAILGGTARRLLSR